MEPKGFHAQILEFPGCYAQGDTLEEAYSNLGKAAESWIDTSLAQGHEIPEPSSSTTHSGRIVLRLPRSIHRQAAEMARRNETSLNTYLVSAVAAKVGAEDLYNLMTNRLEARLVQAAMPFVNYFSAVQTAANTAQKKISHWRPEQIASTTDVLSNIAALRR